MNERITTAIDTLADKVTTFFLGNCPVGTNMEEPWRDAAAEVRKEILRSLADGTGGHADQ